MCFFGSVALCLLSALPHSEAFGAELRTEAKRDSQHGHMFLTTIHEALMLAAIDFLPASPLKTVLEHPSVKNAAVIGAYGADWICDLDRHGKPPLPGFTLADPLYHNGKRVVSSALDFLPSHIDQYRYNVMNATGDEILDLIDDVSIQVMLPHRAFAPDVYIDEMLHWYSSMKYRKFAFVLGLLCHHLEINFAWKACHQLFAFDLNGTGCPSPLIAPMNLFLQPAAAPWSYSSNDTQTLATWILSNHPVFDANATASSQFATDAMDHYANVFPTAMIGLLDLEFNLGNPPPIALAQAVHDVLYRVARVTANAAYSVSTNRDEVPAAAKTCLVVYRTNVGHWYQTNQAYHGSIGLASVMHFLSRTGWDFDLVSREAIPNFSLYQVVILLDNDSVTTPASGFYSNLLTFLQTAPAGTSRHAILMYDGNDAGMPASYVGVKGHAATYTPSGFLSLDDILPLMSVITDPTLNAQVGQASTAPPIVQSALSEWSQAKTLFWREPAVIPSGAITPTYTVNVPPTSSLWSGGLTFFSGASPAPFAACCESEIWAYKDRKGKVAIDNAKFVITTHLGSYAAGTYLEVGLSSVPATPNVRLAFDAAPSGDSKSLNLVVHVNDPDPMVNGWRQVFFKHLDAGSAMASQELELGAFVSSAGDLQIRIESRSSRLASANLGDGAFLEVQNIEVEAGS